MESCEISARSAVAPHASSPPARRHPSPPCPQPCRAGSTNAAPASARWWRWSRHASLPMQDQRRIPPSRRILASRSHLPITASAAAVPCLIRRRRASRRSVVEDLTPRQPARARSAVDPPYRRLLASRTPSPVAATPVALPCHAGSVDVAPAAARQWRWSRRVSPPVDVAPSVASLMSGKIGSVCCWLRGVEQHMYIYMLQAVNIKLKLYSDYRHGGVAHVWGS